MADEHTAEAVIRRVTVPSPPGEIALCQQRKSTLSKEAIEGGANDHQQRAAEELENRERMYMMSLLFGRGMGRAPGQSASTIARRT
jgi:hypothetical protein